MRWPRGEARTHLETRHLANSGESCHTDSGADGHGVCKREATGIGTAKARADLAALERCIAAGLLIPGLAGGAA